MRWLSVVCPVLAVVGCVRGSSGTVSVPAAQLDIDEDVDIPYGNTEFAGYATDTEPVGDLLPDIDDVDALLQEEEIAAPLANNDRSVQLPQTSVSKQRIWYPYDETLRLRPLPRNNLLSSFKFDMNSTGFRFDASLDAVDHYSQHKVFPKAFSSIMEHNSARELHLRFTKGFWDPEAWGSLPSNGFQSGGSGVELWAYIEAYNENDAYKKWKSLVNALSGLFCASVNFIESSRTAYPDIAFQPTAAIPLFNASNKIYTMHAALANEPICTENLTPFIRMLPTRGKTGLATLLDGHKVFDSLWHSLSIDVQTRCDMQTNMCQFELGGEIDVVLHVPTSLARGDRPIPKPLQGDKLRCDETKAFDAFQCFPLPEETDTSYLLSQLFGRTIHGSSLISRQPSKICVDVPQNSWKILLKEDDRYFGTSDNCFDLDKKCNYDVHVESNDTTTVSQLGDVPVFVSRSLAGYGQDRGGIRTFFYNPGNTPITMVYFESLPWFMRVYLSTFSLEDSGYGGLTFDSLISSMHYSPSQDRKRPATLEYTITIPANTSVSFVYQFDKSLLKYAEYPPDANHGFEIESAVITVTDPVEYQVRTATLLLTLSTPDFSMPYNVIILTSTIMGLIFGTLYNLLAKRIVTLEEADRLQSRSGLKAKLALLKSRILRRR